MLASKILFLVIIVKLSVLLWRPHLFSLDLLRRAGTDSAQSQQRLRALLSLHHELALFIYSREAEESKKEMSTVKVFVCSKDKLSQILHFGTDKFFGRDIEILLVRDEYQRDSVEECCLALTMASAVILVGDKNQAPETVQQPIKAPTPLAPWLRHEKMNRFTAMDTVWTTQRFGGPMLECIRASLSHK